MNVGTEMPMAKQTREWVFLEGQDFAESASRQPNCLQCAGNGFAKYGSPSTAREVFDPKRRPSVNSCSGRHNPTVPAVSGSAARVRHRGWPYDRQRRGGGGALTPAGPGWGCRGCPGGRRPGTRPAVWRARGGGTARWGCRRRGWGSGPPSAGESPVASGESLKKPLALRENRGRIAGKIGIEIQPLGRS